MLFENKFFLKLYRKLEDGVNPDVEVTRFLTERAQFAKRSGFRRRDRISPRKSASRPSSVCCRTPLLAESDAWTLTLDHVGRYYERVLARKGRSAK